MKILYLVRHAKSSWKHDDLLDWQRPLKKRGKKDAPMMGAVLRERNVKPDLIISSPAVRAQTTAEMIAAELNSRVELVLEEKLYPADIPFLLEFIVNQEDKYNRIMLVGHNPAFTSLANVLGDQVIDNLPTCGICGFGFDTETWRKASPEKAERLFFIYPKMFR